MKKNHGTNEQRQGGPLVSMCSKQVRQSGVGLISRTSASVFVSARLARSLAPPAWNKNSLGQSVTHTHTEQTSAQPVEEKS